MKAPSDSPTMKEFMDNLNPVNAIADASPGFIWRLQDENGNATGIKPFDDPLVLVNLSVWTDMDSLKNYMLRTGHVDFLKRRYEWFEKMSGPNHVMWWVDNDHTPTLFEAKEKLNYLMKFGDTPDAFSMRRPYSSDDYQRNR
jgi:hypothetical protein